MDRCSRHDIPPAVDPLTDRPGARSRSRAPSALPEQVLTRRRLGTSMPYGCWSSPISRTATLNGHNAHLMTLPLGVPSLRGGPERRDSHSEPAAPCRARPSPSESTADVVRSPLTPALVAHSVFLEGDGGISPRTLTSCSLASEVRR